MTACIIVTDPFARTVTRHPIEAGGTLARALMDVSPSRWNGSTFALYDGAIGPGGAIQAEGAASIRIKDGDLYQVVVLPAEPISTGAAIAAAVGVSSALGVALITVAVYIAIMAITMAISFLATMLLTPHKQSNKATAPEDQPSALNSLTPPRNTYRLGSRVTDIYGTMRFWPDLIFNATSRWEGVGWEDNIETSVENAQTTSQQHVRSVYVLGRGHYQMSDFQFGDSPIANGNGAAYIFPPGVTLPTTVTATYAVADLNQQELGGPASINMWSAWYEIPADQVDRIDIQVSFPSGLINAFSGKKVPAGWVQFMVAEITIQGERLDENGDVIETIEILRPVRAKTRNELRITFQETVTPGRWRIRVAETNDQQPFPNGNTETMVKRTYLEGIVGNRQLTDAERTFEYETVIIVEANNIGGPALQSLENFNLMATRVLPTQDTPGVMTEFRPDGRWITAAINTLTDPFICNYSMSEVDWPSLHAVQASLDAYEEPFTESGFNAALDRQMTADEQLMLIARKARAQVFPSAGLLTFARDERRFGVSALFNRRNRLVGRTDVGMGLQFASRDDPDGVVISWLNGDDGYRQETYTYPVGITPAAPLSIDLIGAVHKWEVCRRARFELAQINYRRRTMPLRVTEEGQLLLPFDRVSVVMPWDEGVIDGEVLEVAGLSLRLNRAVPEDLTDAARIRLRSSDGRQTELIDVAAEPGSGPDWVTLGWTPSFSILAPTEDTQLGTLFSLSLNDASDTATQWIMTGAEIDDQGVAITMIEDADEVYQLSDDLFDPCVDDPDPPDPPTYACSEDGTYGQRWTGADYAWTAEDLGGLAGGSCPGPDAAISRFCCTLRDASGLFANEFMTAENSCRGSDAYLDTATFSDTVRPALDGVSPTLGYTSAMLTDAPSFVNGTFWRGSDPFYMLNAYGFAGGITDNSNGAFGLNPGCGLAPLMLAEGLRTFSTDDVTVPVQVSYAYGVTMLFWSAIAFNGEVIIRSRDAADYETVIGETDAEATSIPNPTGAGFIVYIYKVNEYIPLHSFAEETKKTFSDFDPVIVPRDLDAVMIEILLP